MSISVENKGKKESTNRVPKSGENKFGKYLTEMKELPPTQPEVNEKTEFTENEKIQEPVNDSGEKRKDVLKGGDISQDVVNKADMPDVDDKFADDLEDNPGRRVPITSKDIILGVVNAISVILLIIILVRFPERSGELKELRIQNIRDSLNINLEVSEIEANKPKASKIEEFFLDESGIVNFINDVEEQEVEGGATIEVTFASPSAIKDRTGNFGVPIVIKLAGSWDAIDISLQKISALPYLYRPASLDIGYGIEDPTVIEFKYGVVLYVRESLGQNR